MPYAHNGPVDIWYETFGDPSHPALLLVNGLGSQCINFRADWCERFAADGFHVIRFDNRDVGLSTKFSDHAPDFGAVLTALGNGEEPPVAYKVGEMARDAVAVLDALGIERAHAVGVSMGGMIVQTLAINHADRLLSMTSVMSSTGDLDVGRSSPEAQALIMAPAPTDRDGAVARQLEAARTWGSPACYDEDRIRAWAAEAYDRCFEPAGQARQMLAIMSSGSRTAALASVRLPALVVHGDADKLVDQSGGRRTAEAIPGARFELIAGMGHDYPPEYWDTWIALIGAHARSASPFSTQ
jgi:pimeloyl-ACP methyl ester carboxylesterase